MALTPISNTVEFVQDTVPTTATDGDSWLDTSLSPPRLKVFDDAVGGFIEPRSVQNLDVKVSDAGVNWASKTPKSDVVSAGSTFSISGSGYLLSVTAQTGLNVDSSVKIDIDGTTVASEIDIGFIDPGAASPAFIWRFDSSASITEKFANRSVRIHYVLD